MAKLTQRLTRKLTGPLMRAVPHRATEGVGGWGEAQLTAYLASLSDGFYYDTTKLDRFFQEDTGPTLADDVTEAIGLALDQRTWGGLTLAEKMAGQAEGIRNQSISGAADGTPGTLPTNWSQDPLNALSRTISVGTDADGAPCIDLRINGTTGSTNLSTYFETTTQIAAVLGEMFVGGFKCALIAGSLTNVTSCNLRLIERSNVGGFLTQVLSPLTPSGTAQTFSRYRRVANASTAYVQTAFDITFSSGVVIDLTIRLSLPTLKKVPGQHGVQATGSLKPNRQSTGAKFDGADDNWLTSFLAQNGANFITALVSVPATLAATQVIAGASGAAVNRCFLAIDTSGRLCGGVGSDSTTTILGTSDLRGTDAVVGLSLDGSTVKLFANAAEEYSAAQNSTPTVAIPFRVGGNNNNGTAGSVFAGSVKRIASGFDSLTLAKFQQIRSALLAT